MAVNVLVIFGAGASTDATNKWSTTQYPPPLTDDLFRTDYRPDQRPYLAAAPEASGLFDVLRRRLAAGEGNLEALLRQTADVAEDDPDLAMGLLAVRFYLKQYLWQCGNNVLNADANMTNYTTLVHAVARWQARAQGTVCFVTFNYDFILERALEYEWAWSFHDINSYIQPRRMLIKPHGSVDWGRTLVDDETADRLFDARSMMRSAGVIQYTDRYVKVGGVDTIGSPGAWYAPAIAIPMDQKSQYECPAEHLEALQSFLRGADMVLTIGWKAGDREFVNLLAKYLRPRVPFQVVTLSEQGAKNVVIRLKDAGLGGPGGASAGGFRSWVDTGLSGFIASLGNADQT